MHKGAVETGLKAIAESDVRPLGVLRDVFISRVFDWKERPAPQLAMCVLSLKMRTVV